ncbi:MAG: single-stranded DNA-binding protein [Candidatus Margulisiibacteriota bacterium]|jgi:single-strand DNA-binding protein
MYNKVFLIGRVAKDPELRLTPSGVPVTRFVVAVDRFKKKSNNEDKITDFFRVVAWRRLAEICNQYLKKGKLIEIEGRLQIDSYQKDGESRSITEVIMDNMQMLDKINNDEKSENENQ